MRPCRRGYSVRSLQVEGGLRIQALIQTGVVSFVPGSAIQILSSAHLPIIQSCGVSAERYPCHELKERLPHNHDVVELFFVHSGRGVHHSGDLFDALAPGDMGVVPLGQSHCILTDDEPMDILNIYLDPERFSHSASSPLLRSVLNRLRSGGFQAGKRIPFSPTWTPRRTSQLPNLLGAIEMEVTHRKPGFEQALELYVRLLLLECTRESMELPSPLGSVEPPRHHPSVRRAIAYLHENWDQPVDLAGVALHARASKFHLCRLFRSETGHTVISYLQHLRIDKARRLLLDGDRKIITIALETGFGDLAHFNRTFRRIAGMSPTQFRRTARSESTNTPDSPGCTRTHPA